MWISLAIFGQQALRRRFLGTAATLRKIRVNVDNERLKRRRRFLCGVVFCGAVEDLRQDGGGDAKGEASKIASGLEVSGSSCFLVQGAQRFSDFGLYVLNVASSAVRLDI